MAAASSAHITLTARRESRGHTPHAARLRKMRRCPLTGSWIQSEADGHELVEQRSAVLASLVPALVLRGELKVGMLLPSAALCDSMMYECLSCTAWSPHIAALSADIGIGLNVASAALTCSYICHITAHAFFAN